jgi:hypothetical protein
MRLQTANGNETRTRMVFVAVGEPKRFDIPLKDADVCYATGKRLEATEIKTKLNHQKPYSYLNARTAPITSPIVSSLA